MPDTTSPRSAPPAPLHGPTAALRAALAASPTHGPLWSGPCVLACYAGTRDDIDQVTGYWRIAEELNVSIEYIEGVAAGWDAAYGNYTPYQVGTALQGESRDLLRGWGTGWMLAKEAQQL